MTDKTVNVNELSVVRMVAGNEKKYPTVILGENINDWVGFGWINLRPAEPKDYDKYPTVTYDEA